MNFKRSTKTFALGRLRSGEMNKTEKAYGEYLMTQRNAGAIEWYRFEGMKFRLADNTFYTPDFVIMLPGGEMQIREVKGYMMDDANVKIKVAAEMYPFRFFVIRKQKKKDGGGWEETEI